MTAADPPVTGVKGRVARWLATVPHPVRTALREPLVQFLLLGGALFLLQGWLRPPGAAPGGEIVVSEARVAAIAHTFRRTWQRPPTAEELTALVDDHIREEVLVREALALGLDRDDTIIRRRLRQKMEFLSDERAGQDQPSERQLQAYLEAHPESFRREPRLTFRQIFLDPARRGDALPTDASRLLAELNRPGAPADPSPLGDSLPLLEPRLVEAPQAEVAALFGEGFARELVQRKPGPWVGPLTSGYGVHLVRIEGITPGTLPLLAEVRDPVERDWRNARRRERSEASYQELRSKYAVKVPAPPEGPRPPR